MRETIMSRSAAAMLGSNVEFHVLLWSHCTYSTGMDPVFSHQQHLCNMNVDTQPMAFLQSHTWYFWVCVANQSLDSIITPQTRLRWFVHYVTVGFGANSTLYAIPFLPGHLLYVLIFFFSWRVNQLWYNVSRLKLKRIYMHCLAWRNTCCKFQVVRNHDQISVPYDCHQYVL